MNTILLSLSALTGLAIGAAHFPLFKKRAPEGSDPQMRGFEQPDPTHHTEGIEILDRMGEGVLVVDESLRPYYANPSARRILGLQPG